MGPRDGFVQRERRGGDNGQFRIEWRTNNTTLAITPVHSNLVLDVNGNSKNNGAAIIQWNSNDGLNQMWQLRSTRTFDGYYQISNVNSSKYITIPGNAAGNNVAAVQQDDNGSDGQMFRLVFISALPDTVIHQFTAENAPSGTPYTMADGWYDIRIPILNRTMLIYRLVDEGSRTGAYYLENKGGGQITLRLPDGGYLGADSGAQDGMLIKRVNSPYLWKADFIRANDPVRYSGALHAVTYYTALRTPGNNSLIAAARIDDKRLILRSLSDITLRKPPDSAAIPVNAAFHFFRYGLAPPEASWYTPPAPVVRGSKKTFTAGKFSMEVSNVHAAGVQYTYIDKDGGRSYHYYIIVSAPATARFINENYHDEYAAGRNFYFIPFNHLYYDQDVQERSPLEPDPSPKPIWPTADGESEGAARRSNTIKVKPGGIVSIPQNSYLTFLARTGLPHNFTDGGGYHQGEIGVSVSIYCLSEAEAAAIGSASRPGKYRVQGGLGRSPFNDLEVFAIP